VTNMATFDIGTMTWAAVAATATGFGIAHGAQVPNAGLSTGGARRDTLVFGGFKTLEGDCNLSDDWTVNSICPTGCVGILADNTCDDVTDMCVTIGCVPDYHSVNDLDDYDGTTDTTVSTDNQLHLVDAAVTYIPETDMYYITGGRRGGAWCADFGDAQAQCEDAGCYYDTDTDVCGVFYSDVLTILTPLTIPSAHRISPCPSSDMAVN